MKQEVEDLALKPFLESAAHKRMMTHAVPMPRSTITTEPTGLFSFFQNTKGWRFRFGVLGEMIAHTRGLRVFRRHDWPTAIVASVNVHIIRPS